ncbi:MAG TPA: TonB-dependent receptor, partial [Archaeoglobus profundus]|nr:TonB-dependent receptor [Archaeoglobus profundus]
MEAVKNALANLGYDTGAIQGFTHDSGSTKGIIKLDYNLSDDHKLALIYNFLDASKEKPAHPTAIRPRGPNFNTLQFENSGYQINNKIQSFLVELNSNFSDKISNKYQMGYTHFDDFRDPKSKPAPVINISKGGNNYIVAGHEPFSVNNRLDQKVFQISDNVNILLDKHNVTLGFNFEKFMFKNSFNLVAYDNFGTFGSHGNYYGNFNAYPDVATFLADAADPNGLLATNLAYAQSQFDNMNNAGAGNDFGWRLAELNVGQLAGYVQDEWSATDYLKLTFGVRLDKPMYFNTSDLIQKYLDTQNFASRDNTIDYFDPETGDAVKLNSTVLPTDKMIVSPRFGFNWDAKGDKTLQVRGGTGVFTGRLPFVWLGNQVSGADDGYFQIVDKDFEWPRVWKSSLGVDNKFENGLVASADFSYTKDLVAAHVQNWGLKKPTGNLVGVDKRPIYTAADKGANNAYVFTNSDQGYAVNATFKLEKSFENKLYTSLAYNFMEAKSVNSIEAEITGDAFDFNPNLGDANKDVLTHSKYGDRHRIIGVLSKKWEYGNDKWATTFSTFFEYAKGGRFSYTYAGNINNDSSFQNNDLIYIPTESEIASMNFSGAGQGADWNKYIEQDDYLSANRGKYAERYGVLSPWRSK